MRDNGNEALLGSFRDEDLATLLLRENDHGAQTALDSHLASDNFSTSFFGNFIG
jgi:hypothetical protein